MLTHYLFERKTMLIYSYVTAIKVNKSSWVKIEFDKLTAGNNVQLSNFLFVTQFILINFHETNAFIYSLFTSAVAQHRLRFKICFRGKTKKQVTYRAPYSRQIQQVHTS
jgi:hypothetical protein